MLSKFTIGSKIIDKILESQKSSYDKIDIGYTKWCSKNFGKRTKIKAIQKLGSKCTFCSNHGHRDLFCPIKMGVPYKLKRFWIPNGEMKIATKKIRVVKKNDFVGD